MSFKRWGHLRILSSVILLLLPVGLHAEPFKVGVTVPLSGGLADIGQSVKNGIMLASQENDPDARVQFLFDDDQLQPAKTVSAVRNFIDLQKVKALIVFGTGNALAVNNIAEKAEIPMLASSIDDKVVAGKKFIMKHWVSVATLNQAVVDEVKRRGYKRVAIVATEQDAMLALKDLFKKSLPDRVVFDEAFIPGETEFRSSVIKIKQAKPDAVYLILLPPQTAIFAKALASVEYSGEFFGAHPLENRNEIKAANGVLDNAWFVTGAVFADKGFRERYVKVFGVEPENGAPNGYDMAKMIIQGVKSEAPLNEYLHSLNDFHGVMGHYGATGNNDFSLTAVVRTVRELRGF